MVKPPISFSEGVVLSSYTTIGLGGPARYFVECRSVDELRDSLKYAGENHLRVQILGGGSNTIFADKGFDGLVIRLNLRELSFRDEGSDTVVTAAGGEEWDGFVSLCVDKGLAGVECLAGIPGLVGATPVQNVGAYGQEVSNTIVSLKALHRQTLELTEFSGADCRFGYRQSRFKSADRDRYVIIEVSYKLRRNGRPAIRYPELQKYIDANIQLASLPDGRAALTTVSSAVIALRKKKSMVLDQADPNTRSVGSFFMNPIITATEFEAVRKRWTGTSDRIPSFPAGQGMKIPAAWLVEKSGFPRGYRRGGVGISANHSLALINCGGTASEMIAFAMDIRKNVEEMFGITLELEPEVVA